MPIPASAAHYKVSALYSFFDGVRRKELFFMEATVAYVTYVNPIQEKRYNRRIIVNAETKILLHLFYVLPEIRLTADHVFNEFPSFTYSRDRSLR